MKLHRSSLFVGCALYALGAGTAFAQDAETAREGAGAHLDTIVVTAQKRSENVQDIPIAISAFNGDTLEDRGIESAEDLQFLVPGLAISEVATAEKANVTLRGVGDLAGGDPTVPIYIDGHYLQFTSFITRDFFDVERVEVQRGPQGTLYGRNAVGGTINVITKRPTDTFEAGLSVDLGSYDKRLVQGYVSGPLTDRLRARVAVSDERRDGFVTNLYNGKDLLTSNYTSVRGALEFDASDNLEFYASAYHYKDTGQSTVARISGPYVSAPFYDTYGLTNVSADDPWVVNTDVDHWNVDKAYGGSFDVTLDLGGVIFKSLSGYHNAEKGGNVDTDTTPLAGVASLTDIGKSESYTQEFQLVSNTDSPLQFVLGAFYFHEKSRETFLLAQNLPCLGGDIDACANVGYANFGLFIGSTESYDSYAAFGQVDYALTEQLHLSLGARYSIDERDRVNEFGIDVANFPIQNPINYTPLSGSWKEPTWKAALRYELTPEQSLYASYSKGYKAGGFSGDPVDPTYEPEILNAYEIGFKGEFFDNSLRFNAAAFYYDYQDKIQDVLITDPTTLETFESFTNAAAAEVIGVEFELLASPADGLTLNAAFGYQDATFKQYESEDPANPGAGLQDLSGRRLPMAPKWTANLGAQYEWGLGDLGWLTARADSALVGNQYLRQFNAANEFQKSYTRTNLRLTWDSYDDRYSVSVYANNLEDKAVKSSLVVGGSASLGPQPLVAYQNPRTFGVVFGFEY